MPHRSALPMATRVLTMSARLAPMPEEPVFAQLKPVLGAREAPVFPGEDLKQQQQPPQQQQHQHPGGGGGGGGAALPGEEMVQVGAGGTGWGRAAGPGRGLRAAGRGQL